MKKIKSENIEKLKDVLYSDEFRSALQSITGVKLLGLTKDVAISAAIYESTDRLLCHDDELEGRRIAFILYLVEDWTDDDAGHLDLFNVDPDTV